MILRPVKGRVLSPVSFFICGIVTNAVSDGVVAVVEQSTVGAAESCRCGETRDAGRRRASHGRRRVANSKHRCTMLRSGMIEIATAAVTRRFGQFVVKLLPNPVAAGDDSACLGERAHGAL